MTLDGSSPGKVPCPVCWNGTGVRPAGKWHRDGSLCWSAHCPETHTECTFCGGQLLMLRAPNGRYAHA